MNFTMSPQNKWNKIDQLRAKLLKSLQLYFVSELASQMDVLQRQIIT